jgi:hypothetical protein
LRKSTMHSCNHLDETLRDAADTTDGFERRLDARSLPASPRYERRDGEVRVETGALKASRCVTEGTGENGDEESQPRKLKVPPDEAKSPHTRSGQPRVKSRDRGDVEVEPGSEADVERNKSVAYEEADAVVDGKVVGLHRDAQDDEERGSATVHERSTSGVEGHDQRTSTHDEDIPVTLQDTLPPFSSPVEQLRDDARLSSARSGCTTALSEPGSETVALGDSYSDC